MGSECWSQVGRQALGRCWALWRRRLLWIQLREPRLWQPLIKPWATCLGVIGHKNKKALGRCRWAEVRQWFEF